MCSDAVLLTSVAITGDGVRVNFTNSAGATVLDMCDLLSVTVLDLRSSIYICLENPLEKNHYITGYRSLYLFVHTLYIECLSEVGNL